MAYRQWKGCTLYKEHLPTMNNPMCSHHFRNSEVPLYQDWKYSSCERETNISHGRTIGVAQRQFSIKITRAFFFEGKLLKKKSENPLQQPPSLQKLISIPHNCILDEILYYNKCHFGPRATLHCSNSGQFSEIRMQPVLVISICILR